MGRIGLPELIVVLVIILVLFGAKRLPEIARSISDAIRQFKRAQKDEEE